MNTIPRLEMNATLRSLKKKIPALRRRRDVARRHLLRWYAANRHLQGSPEHWREIANKDRVERAYVRAVNAVGVAEGRVTPDAYLDPKRLP